jgi:hypothetical protein
MREIAGTDTCQLHHLGYAISGLMHVVTNDGQELEHPARVVYEIPSGHDAWVVASSVGDGRVDECAGRSASHPKGPASGPGDRPVHGHRRLDGDDPAADRRFGVARRARPHTIGVCATS